MKMWAGRFEKETDKLADEFNSSLPFDKTLIEYDIAGSIAHATMLGETGIIAAADAQKIADGLRSILNDYKRGKLKIKGAEDIHMFVEEQLTKRIGSAGKKVHTARSRNDQVALDLKLYLKDTSGHIRSALIGVIETLAGTAKKHLGSYMSGYTHLQIAQPVTLGHFLCAHAFALTRDVQRLINANQFFDVMPLGAGALAGTSFPIDRARVAELLGFGSVTDNSLDTVADRDFAVEFLYCCASIMTHCSRLCEDLILWSTSEFGYAELDERYSTGSSMMPNKKNPDMLELIRGKTGRVYGSLFALLTVLKGLPMAYNKDMQEDKEAVFDAADTVYTCLRILKEVIATTAFNTARMEKCAAEGYSAATDAADYLAKKGLPFRDAHRIAGRITKYCIKKNKTFEDLTLKELKKFSPLYDGGAPDALKLTNVVGGRNSFGGPAETAAALERLEKKLEKMR
ncbi:MAG: argininosuccinate lyase [Firmicutes bacterium]|nr:argininosuccinate lyase [Bacillota bacterium]